MKAILTTFIFIGFLIGNSIANAQVFNIHNFDNDSTHITNTWFPLTPGTQFIYEGTTREEDKKISHKIVSTVTDLVKVINNVKTVVVFEQDYREDELAEVELVFFAQDKDGNVWHLGQYTEEHDNGELIGGRAWLVGCLEGARAGIMMQAQPKVGSPSYEQGYAPAPFNWTDKARVASMGAKRKVPFGKYDNVLVIEEYSDTEPDAIQIKYFAPGVGNIEVGWKGKDKQQESLGLVKIVKLDEIELANVRKEALKLEERAYVYSKTSPAKTHSD